MIEKKDAKLSKLKQAEATLSNTDKYKKYAASDKTLKQHAVAKIPTWIKTNVIAGATLFLLGSALWVFRSHTRSFDPDYDEPGGPKTGAYLDHRTYQQAFKDAYWPMVNGEFSPEYDWYLTVGMILTFAAFSLAGTGISAKKNYKKDVKATQTQVDIMLEIERLAKKHNLDATAAKKIVKVAPEIIKHMSADSRVYFDMIMDGKVSIEDENFSNVTAAIMTGHLYTHPEDMELVVSTFDERSIPETVMAMYNKQQHEER